MRSLIERHGAIATVAPSMREVPLEHNDHILEFGAKLLNHQFHTSIFMTGVGAKALMAILETRYRKQDVLEAMRQTTVAVRGPKPATVLREWNLRIDVRAPEPNTWHELIAELRRSTLLRERHIAVQEYGKPSTEFYDALKAEGATVTSVPVYRWELPQDRRPLKSAIRATIAGDFDIVMFTSAQQIHHVLQVAADEQLEEAWRKSLKNVFVASIGPTASETLRDVGLPVHWEPTHPKMGTLVKEAITRFREQP